MDTVSPLARHEDTGSYGVPFQGHHGKTARFAFHPAPQGGAVIARGVELVDQKFMGRVIEKVEAEGGFVARTLEMSPQVRQ
jgi:hypothetical protein